MFQLKNYQNNALSALRAFLSEARLSNPTEAFKKVTTESGMPSSYNTHGLGDIPYVCLRLPTGGGKTVLASYSIKEAAQNYLETDFPLVLWLVPTSTIREQTLDALSKPWHPYRQAIEEYFQGNVIVKDIADVATLRPKDIESKLCIVVGTFATGRVKDTSIRDIYAHKEDFEPHFSKIPQNTVGLECIEDGPDKGKIKFSFANLCFFHRPLVIMDEAHNARTSLTFDTLKKVHPACIIEFTATPDTSREQGSNVLFSVSASELKVEEMIKLPIMLSEHQTWQEAVRDSVLTLNRLTDLAKNEKDFIRPIALLQAESKDREVTVEVLKKHLIENEKINAEAIAIATGSQREIDGVNLFDPTCPIQYIITVEALKEGWDCSFAYVFCSVANIRSAKDVEQLLGRVLRMPYAKSRATKELNSAYAHVSSPTFSLAAQQLRDNLINMGFEEIEASTFLQPQQEYLLDITQLSSKVREDKPFIFVLPKEITSQELPASISAIAKVESKDGSTTVAISGTITEEIEADLSVFFQKQQQSEYTKEIKRHRMMQIAQMAPSVRGDTFSVPRLCVAIQGEMEFPDRELFLETANWDILNYLPELTEAEFKIEESAHAFEVDIEGKKVVYHAAEQLNVFDLNDIPTNWTELELSRWLDRQVYQPDIPQPKLLEFLRQMIANLVNNRKIPLSALVRAKFILCKSIANKISGYRDKAQNSGYQTLLFSVDSKVETSFDYCFNFNPSAYPAKPPFYSGSYRFQKHFYPVIGDLKASGEEFECAVALDRLSEVKHWVRNMPQDQKFSFWLPTSKYNFYPDFVAELKDGRILVVEYKGEMLEDYHGTLEKQNIGQLWEEKSNGKGLFLMAVKKDDKGCGVMEQLKTKIFSDGNS
jgi:type III restriction enzyme